MVLEIDRVQDAFVESLFVRWGRLDDSLPDLKRFFVSPQQREGLRLRSLGQQIVGPLCELFVKVRQREISDLPFPGRIG